MRTIAFYVSGHGFGHARRAATLIRALVEADGGLRVVVRTSAPAGLFGGIVNARVSPPEESFDPGVVERDPLTIDGEASVRRLGEVLARRGEIVRREAAFLREVAASLVIADIPFLAGDAAEAAGVPCDAVGNFTWDWIYEPFATTAESQRLVEVVRDSYRRMRTLYQLPFGHEVSAFREVVPVPLLAKRSRADRSETLARLGVAERDGRPRVLIAMRGGVAPEAVRGAAAESPDALFFANQAVDGAPENLHALEAGVADFTDVLAACDAAVSKVGYGIVSDCIANGVALLHPPRQGFREDAITVREAPAHARMRGMPVADFESGAWAAHLGALLGQPRPSGVMSVNGAALIAGRIVERLRGGK